MSRPRELELYPRVRRRRELEFFLQALESGGCEILERPAPDVAPFQFSIELPTGEPLDLVCYLFSANKYRQAGRPTDEHRLQVKYGSEFGRPHEIYQPQTRGEVTLFLGVHLEEQVMIAADPAMHRWTWFSRSIEFKDRHVEAIHASGWFGWERERKEPKRPNSGNSTALHELGDASTETLLGFEPRRIVDYLLLERIATGLPPGERLLRIERNTFPKHDDDHALEQELGLTREEILDMIGTANRLKVAVRGRAAEKHLERALKAETALDSVEEIDRDGQPDFLVRYRGREFRLECKNTLRGLNRGLPKVDFQKTRASKGDPCSRYYRADQFEVLAACLHPVSEKWEFRFRATAELSPHPKCLDRLHHIVLVSEDEWSPSIEHVLDGIIAGSD